VLVCHPQAAQEIKAGKTDPLSLKRLLAVRKIIIAIDGFSACGKSTTAKETAKILGYRYIDSGAMYRAVTMYFLDHLVALSNPKEVHQALEKVKISFRVNSHGVTETFLNGLNVEGDIRKMKISENVSQVSAIREVRAAMVHQQRKLGKERGIVMDGRDIGTVVFPEAELKMFLTADMMVRAFRRQRELLERNDLVDLDEIIANLRSRDEIDSTRSESPLTQAADAELMNTTHITIEEQVDEVVRMALGRMLRVKQS
jgi:cytidylate kinase